MAPAVAHAQNAVIASIETLIRQIDEVTSRTTQAKVVVVDKLAAQAIRPTSLDQYLGQTNVVERLRIAVKAAHSRSEPLEHMLLAGPPGLGKTTLAQIAANAMGARCIITSGPAIERPADLVGVLKSLQLGDFLFIDEIHRLPKVVEEFLYSVMEDFRADYIEGSKTFARTMSVNVQRFTLVGATTRAGALAAPLRDRFGMIFHMEYYTPVELASIIQRSASVLGIPSISLVAVGSIASRSRGTPRIANRLLRRVRDYALSVRETAIVGHHTDVALRAEGINCYGLDRLDRSYLSTIENVYKGGPVGAAAIASTISEATATLVDMVEPYLLQQGYIGRTPRGRVITELGRKALVEA